jgi:hypothetical protein
MLQPHDNAPIGYKLRDTCFFAHIIVLNGGHSINVHIPLSQTLPKEESI